MEENYNINEEVYKCSKCGLCKSVCPIYSATKNEKFLPRGRYIALNNYSKSSQPIEKNFVKDLDICLNCNTCRSFCPSNIDTYKINTILKNKKSYFTLLPFSFIYKCLLNMLRIISFIYKIFPFKFLLKDNIIGKLFEEKIKRRKKQIKSKNELKIVYFEGCINKYINSSDKNAVLNIIEDMNCIVSKVISNCCGYPYFSEGNIKKYTKNLKKVLQSIPNNTDYIVCSCDTCVDTLKKGVDYIPEGKEIINKLITIDEFLKLKKYNIKEKNEALYYKPLLRIEPCFLPHNINRIEKKQLCSAMENFLIIKHPKISKQIIETSFLKKEEIDKKTIVTSCLISKIGLLICLIYIGANTAVMTYSEYIEKEK